jgi:hypothetical protein
MIDLSAYHPTVVARAVEQAEQLRRQLVGATPEEIDTMGLAGYECRAGGRSWLNEETRLLAAG